MANITKRGNGYRIKVSCGYDMNGKQLTKSMTWTPDEKMTDRQVEKELNRQAIEFESKVGKGEYSTESRLLLAEFCPQYIDMVGDTLSPTTLSSYELAIKNYITPALGHLRLNTIRPKHVQLFVNEMSRPGARADGKEEKAAPSTIRRNYSVLRSILTKAYKLDMIETNPTSGGKIDLPPLGSTTTDIFTKEETIQMLDCLSNEPLMYQALIQLAIVSGCRRGELVALQWNDIDFDKCSVSVSKSNYQLVGESIKTKEPKTRSSNRLIAIPVESTGILKASKNEQAKRRLQLGDKWHDGNWVFTQWDGKPMNPHTPTHWFSDFLERNNLPHRKFHALRHTSATLLLTSGANIKTVSSRLGHSELSTTNRYVHAVETADRIAANTLGEVFTATNDGKNNDHIMTKAVK